MPRSRELFHVYIHYIIFSSKRKANILQIRYHDDIFNQFIRWCPLNAITTELVLSNFSVLWNNTYNGIRISKFTKLLALTRLYLLIIGPNGSINEMAYNLASLSKYKHNFFQHLDWIEIQCDFSIVYFTKGYQRTYIGFGWIPFFNSCNILLADGSLLNLPID